VRSVVRGIPGLHGSRWLNLHQRHLGSGRLTPLLSVLSVLPERGIQKREPTRFAGVHASMRKAISGEITARLFGTRDTSSCCAAWVTVSASAAGTAITQRQSGMQGG